MKSFGAVAVLGFLAVLAGSFSPLVAQGGAVTRPYKKPAPTPAPTPAAAARSDAAGPVDWAAQTPPPRYASQAVDPVATMKQMEASAGAAGEFNLATNLEGFPGAVGPESLSGDLSGQYLTISAPILAVSPSRNDRMPTTLTVCEDPLLQIAYYPEIKQVVEGGKGFPVAGQTVSARGLVTKFRDAFQISIDSASNLILQDTGRNAASIAGEMAGDATADLRTIMDGAVFLDGVTVVSKLGDVMNEPVVIVGYVSNLREAWSATAPNILTVQDTTGSASVVFWSDINDAIDKSLLAEGTPVVLAGLTSEFKGRIQIKLAAAASIEKVDGANLPAQVARVASVPPAQ